MDGLCSRGSFCMEDQKMKLGPEQNVGTDADEDRDLFDHNGRTREPSDFFKSRRSSTNTQLSRWRLWKKILNLILMFRKIKR